jgi:hypothetical protein
MMTRRTSEAGLLCLLLSFSPAFAWDAGGHYRVAEAAVLALPEEVPGFFRWGAETVAHVAIDPDVMKSRDTPQLGHQEYPEHFLDYELLHGAALPDLRYDFVAKVIESGQEPSRVGFVPYAVIEGTQRLSLAFAEYRCWPDNPHVHGKALVYAGLLAHYAGDMIQPLHTSVHYDGRANAAGESPHSGIHRRMDSLFEQPGIASTGAPFEVQATAELWPAVVAEFMASHALVDRVYALDPALQALYATGTWDPELSAFAAERYRHTVEFLAGLYLTAWRQSATVELSPWLRRRGPGGELAPCDAP